MADIAITSGPPQVWRDGYVWLRRHLDWLVPLAVIVAVVKERAFITHSFATERWNLGGFYAAVFDWSSIQAAFLFSVFAFFLARSEPFIQAISGTVPFRALRKYVLRSLVLSMGLTLVSLPPLVNTPDMVDGAYLNAGFIVFLFVTAFLSYTFMCFVKVVRVFYKLEKAS
jgi:hypothetical protein